jgi:hypothetical protein
MRRYVCINWVIERVDKSEQNSYLLVQVYTCIYTSSRIITLTTSGNKSPQKFCKENFSILQNFSEIAVICMLAYAYHFRIFARLINAIPRSTMFLSIWNHSILMILYDAQTLIIFEWRGRMSTAGGEFEYLLEAEDAEHFEILLSRISLGEHM